MDITQLPFNKLIGIEPCSEEDAVLRLPADSHYGNHLGTVHAGALMALAEAASGAFLLKKFPGLSVNSIPVVRRFEARFKKPAHGSVTAKATVSDEQLAAFQDSYARRARASTDVSVSLFDDSGTLVLSATANWFVAKTANES